MARVHLFPAAGLAALTLIAGAAGARAETAAPDPASPTPPPVIAPWTAADRTQVADMALATAATLPVPSRGRVDLALAESLAPFDRGRARESAVAAAAAAGTQPLAVAAAGLLVRLDDREGALAIVRAATVPTQRARILVRIATEALKRGDAAFFLASVAAARKANREAPPFQAQRLDIGPWLSTLAAHDDAATAQALAADLTTADEIGAEAAAARQACHPGTPFAEGLAARAETTVRAMIVDLAPGADQRAVAGVEIIALCRSLAAAKMVLAAVPPEKGAAIQFAMAGFLKASDPAAFPLDSDDPVLVARSAAALAKAGAKPAADEALTRAATMMSALEPQPGWSGEMRNALLDMHRDVALAFAEAGHPAAALAALAPVQGVARLAALVVIVRQAAGLADEAGVRSGVADLVALIRAHASTLPNAPFQLRALKTSLTRFPEQATVLGDAVDATFGPQAGMQQNRTLAPPVQQAKVFADAMQRLLPSIAATDHAVALADRGTAEAAISEAAALQPTAAEVAIYDSIRRLMREVSPEQALLSAGILGIAGLGSPDLGNGFAVNSLATGGIGRLVATASATSPSQAALMALDRIFLKRGDAAALAKVQPLLAPGDNADAGAATSAVLMARADPHAAWMAAKTIASAPARMTALLALLKAPVIP